jgi:hypothetical protein
MGKCAGCDNYQQVNDIGLCNRCNQYVEEEMIQQNAVEYSITQYCIPIPISSVGNRTTQVIRLIYPSKTLNTYKRIIRDLLNDPETKLSSKLLSRCYQIQGRS